MCQLGIFLRIAAIEIHRKTRSNDSRLMKKSVIESVCLAVP